MKKEIKITISPDIIKQRLKEIFDKAGDSNSELMSRIIVENLATSEVGISQLIFAFMGIEEEIPWLVGDMCKIHPDYVSNWDCAKDHMIEKEHNMHKGYFIGRIVDINMRKERNIKFEIQGLEKSKDKFVPKVVTGSAPASTIKMVLDLPDNFEEKRGDVASIL